MSNIFWEHWPSLNEHRKKRSFKEWSCTILPRHSFLPFDQMARHMETPLVEVFVEPLAGYDPSPAEGAYRSSWFGTEKALVTMLESLGFAAFDIQGVKGALHSHRDADRRLSVTPDQLQAAGFQELAQVSK